jgi:hypothetical protein
MGKHLFLGNMGVLISKINSSNPGEALNHEFTFRKCCTYIPPIAWDKNPSGVNGATVIKNAPIDHLPILQPAK